MMTNSLLFLTIFLGTSQKMKAFMLCGVTCPLTVAIVMLKGILSLIVPKNVHPMFVGTVVLVAILLLNAQKARISHLKRPGKLLLLYRTE
jgi:type IV secretory pathway VirB3-like protein